jgi:hypothetical protein
MNGQFVKGQKPHNFLHGETKDLTPWETEFAESIEPRAVLTEKQENALEKIWQKHFAG